MRRITVPTAPMLPVSVPRDAGATRARVKPLKFQTETLPLPVACGVSSATTISLRLTPHGVGEQAQTLGDSIAVGRARGRTDLEPDAIGLESQARGGEQPPGTPPENR